MTDREDVNITMLRVVTHTLPKVLLREVQRREKRGETGERLSSLDDLAMFVTIMEMDGSWARKESWDELYEVHADTIAGLEGEAQVAMQAPQKLWAESK